MTASRKAAIEARRSGRVLFGNVLDDTAPRVHEEYVTVASPLQLTDDTPGVAIPEKLTVSRRLRQTDEASKKYVAPKTNRDGDTHSLSSTPCIRICNMPFDITEEQLTEEIQSCGLRTRRVKVIEAKGVAYVTMFSHEDAKCLIERMPRIGHMILSVELVPVHKGPSHGPQSKGVTTSH